MATANLSREQAYEMLLRHEDELKSLRELVKKLTAKPAAPDAGWSRDLADDWKLVYTGDCPKRLFKQVKPLVEKYTWERLRPVLKAYFMETPATFVDVEKVVGGSFGALEKGLRKEHRTPDPVEAKAVDESEAAVAWIQEHGGFESVAEKLRALCGDDRAGLDKAYAAVGVPHLARILVGRYV